jgi:predicted glycoside hydrolase/deacetylase ChbG (UPF0249 family)
MCQASLQAFADLWEAGSVTSGATMVPCPWFPATAAYCREHPEVDMGVHATLNCEWPAYRWGALSTVDPQSGLLDDDGYLHSTSEAAIMNASAQAVTDELSAQIGTALKAGIDITHVDSHMGTILHPKFIETYLTQAFSKAVPAMLPRPESPGAQAMAASNEQIEQLKPLAAQIEARGLPLMDGIMMMPLDQPKGQMEVVKQMIAALPVGITHFILHPAVNSPEVQAACPDWESRVANYETLMDPAFKQILADEGVKPIGYRHLRDLLRRTAA